MVNIGNDCNISKIIYVHVISVLKKWGL